MQGTPEFTHEGENKTQATPDEIKQKMSVDFDNVERQNSGTVDKGDSLVDNIKSEKSILIEELKNEKEERMNISPDSGKNAAKNDEKPKDDDGQSSESISTVVDETTPYEEPAKFLSAFNAIRLLMRFTMTQFFQDITVIGHKNVPKRGPVIFCGNHCNQFVDGAILFFSADRDVRFMVAAKSMRRPVLKQCFEGSKSIPVERAQDLAKVGDGTVRFEDNLTVNGRDTIFTKNFKAGDSIKILTKGDQVSVEDQMIIEIVSDTQMKLKSPGAQMFDSEVSYKFKILPKVDQSNVFGNVSTVLAGGGCVAMFPEGGSHDQSDLLPFKAGIALMAFNTIMNTGIVPVIIPSGLKYFKRQEFRSRVVLEYGRPYKPSRKLIEMYRSGEKRQAVGIMLKQLQDRMREVTMTAPSYDELQAVYMARNLYLPKDIVNYTQEQENEIYQKFSEGYNKVKNEPEMKQLVEAVTSYRKMLKLFNINDSQIKLFKQSFTTQIVMLIVSLIRLIFSLIFVIPGNLMTFPLSTAIAFYTEQERIKALKGSSVKIKANDVRSSIKILAYMSTYPVYLCIFTLLFNSFLKHYYGQDFVHRYAYSVVFFWTYPIISIISIRSTDGMRTHYTEFQGRFLSLFYVGQVELIKETRKVLKAKIRKNVDTYGAKIYKNYDKLRNVMFDPTVSQRSKDRKRSMKKSSSQTRLERNRGLEFRSKRQGNPLLGSMHEFQGGDKDINIDSSMHSFEIVETEFINENLNLDYIDELELNQAFSVFEKNI